MKDNIRDSNEDEVIDLLNQNSYLINKINSYKHKEENNNNKYNAENALAYTNMQTINEITNKDNNSNEENSININNFKENDSYFDALAIEDEFEPVGKSSYYNISLYNKKFNDFHEIEDVNVMRQKNDENDYNYYKEKGNSQLYKLRKLLVSKFIGILNTYVRKQLIYPWEKFKKEHKLYKICYNKSNAYKGSTKTTFNTHFTVNNKNKAPNNLNKPLKTKLSSKVNIDLNAANNLRSKQSSSNLRYEATNDTQNKEDTNKEQINNISDLRIKYKNNNLKSENKKMTVNRTKTNITPNKINIKQVSKYNPWETHKDFNLINKENIMLINTNTKNTKNDKAKYSCASNTEDINKNKADNNNSSNKHNINPNYLNSSEFNNKPSILKIKQEEYYIKKEEELKEIYLNKYIKAKYSQIIAVAVINYVKTSEKKTIIEKYKLQLAISHHLIKLKRKVMTNLLLFSFESYDRSNSIYDKIRGKILLKNTIILFNIIKKQYYDISVVLKNQAVKYSNKRIKKTYSGLLFKGLKVLLEEKEESLEKKRLKDKLFSIASSIIDNNTFKY